MKRHGLEVLRISEVKMRGVVRRRLVILHVYIYIQGCKKVDPRQVLQYCCQRSLVRFEGMEVY